MYMYMYQHKLDKCTCIYNFLNLKCLMHVTHFISFIASYLFFFWISSTSCWMCSCINSIFSFLRASPRWSFTILSINIWLLGSTCSVMTGCSWTGSEIPGCLFTWQLEDCRAELFSDTPIVFNELLELVRDPMLVESLGDSPFVSKFSSLFLACCNCLVRS